VLQWSTGGSETVDFRNLGVIIITFNEVSLSILQTLSNNALLLRESIQ
jgi:hypothetical protein